MTTPTAHRMPAGRGRPMNRPVWLLDVDGVINATRPGWGAAPRSATAYSGDIAYRLRWAPALIERIRALHRAGSVEIRWCSTWCADAEQVERLLALPRLARCWSDRPSADTAATAKLAAARDILAQGRRLIWTDDVEVPTSGPIHDELTHDGRALLIAPSPGRGLQPEHLDAIEAFISAAAAEASGPAVDATPQMRPCS
ncbi:HAD domain-containing protein [Planobispora rosea]|uniref:HAD domain-containing protein n=1 Tax=Planobispora rosea TaxID=35762 RepID=UPI001C400E7E|nr:HAD domain-containing protein [Planobispora rosea]